MAASKGRKWVTLAVFWQSFSIFLSLLGLLNLLVEYYGFEISTIWQVSREWLLAGLAYLGIDNIPFLIGALLVNVVGGFVGAALWTLARRSKV